jgi:hypothetical protein
MTQEEAERILAPLPDDKELCPCGHCGMTNRQQRLRALMSRPMLELDGPAGESWPGPDVPPPEA